MKKSVLMLAALFIIMTSSVASAQPKKVQPQMQQNGRYQIISVEYDCLNMSRGILKKSVLKFDTLTGETWILKDDLYKTPDGNTNYNRVWESFEFHMKGKESIE
ncbi:MAG: hypothetical protein NT178_18895 [Proteobacteria bacterium]|nr:hypothetical protein [Pseudomonadota bacterium]